MTARPEDLAGTPWPLGLSLEQAARFVGVSEGHFRAHCPVIPVTLGTRKLYDRDRVAAWFKGLAGSVDGARAVVSGSLPRRSTLEAVDEAFTKERRHPQARRRHG